MAKWTTKGLKKIIHKNLTIEESENRNGHAISKHNAVSKEDLKRRCEEERKTSTSFKKDEMEDLIIKTLTDSNYRGGNIHFITEWLNDYSWGDALAIDLYFGKSTGYGYQYNKSVKSATGLFCNGVTVVIEKLDDFDYVPFYIKTAYPCKIYEL